MVITAQEFYQSLKETLALTAGVDGSSIESEFIRFGLDKLVDFGDIDDDGDGFTTKVEISKGTNYLDKNSHP